MSNVRIEPLKNGAAVAPRGPRPDIIALALVLFVFGGIAWVAGSKYTVEGWVIGLSLFANWLGIDTTLPTPRGVPLLALILGVGLIYSLVELLIWRASVRRRPVFWVGWLPIVITDVWSTLVGVLAVTPSDPLILRQIAALLPLALLWSLALTFVPEWMAVKIGAQAKSGEKYQRRSREIKAAVAQLQQRYPTPLTDDQAALREALELPPRH